MSISPEAQQRISILRQKAVEGTLTQEEMKEGVRLMRADRLAAPAASAAARRSSAGGKTKAAIPSADDMLDELGK